MKKDSRARTWTNDKKFNQTTKAEDGCHGSLQKGKSDEGIHWGYPGRIPTIASAILCKLLLPNI